MCTCVQPPMHTQTGHGVRRCGMCLFFEGTLWELWGGQWSICCILVWVHQMKSLKAASHLGIPGVRDCLALSSSTGPGLKAILYLKQAEAYVSLIFTKANPSFLYECSKWQIQAGCSALGVRRSCGFPFLCYCASAEHCVHEISTGWMVKLEAQRSDKEQCKWIQKGFGSFSWWASRWQMLLGVGNEK